MQLASYAVFLSYDILHQILQFMLDINWIVMSLENIHSVYKPRQNSHVGVLVCEEVEH